MSVLTLNGRSLEVPDGATLRDLVADVTDRPLAPDGSPADGGRLGVAVAVDSVVVPRSRWQSTALDDGQHVELITAMQGG